MRRAFTLVAVMALAAIVGGSASAGVDPNVTKPYVGVVGDLTVLCNLVPNVAPPTTDGLGIGGNCFDVTNRYLNVAVVDMVSTDVGFQVGWYNATGARLGAFVPGCNSGFFIAPGPDAVAMKVFVDGPLNGPTDCGVALPGGIGVLGDITVSPIGQ